MSQVDIEILFKAKTPDGKTVIGLPMGSEENTFTGYTGMQVCDETGYWGFKSIMPETLGQYIGWRDKEGNRIFRRDIVEFDDLGEIGPRGESYESDCFDFKNRAEVVFKEGRWTLENFWVDESGTREDIDSETDLEYLFKSSRIVGTSYDNPDLLIYKED